MTDKSKPYIALINDTEKNNSSRWLVTFADLLALMLAFFVLFYSVSVIEPREWFEFKKSLQQRLNPLEVEEEINLPEEKSVQKQEEEKGEEIRYIYLILKDKLRLNRANKIQISDHDDHVELKVKESDIFKNISEKNTKNKSPKEENDYNNIISDDGTKILGIILSLIESVDNRIEVHGMIQENKADDASDYVSNLNKSLKKARYITQYFKDYGYKNEILSVGHAHHQKNNEVNSLKRDSYIGIVIEKQSAGK